MYSTEKKESPFYDANKALLISCSSDWYMGHSNDGQNHDGSKLYQKWKFRGSNNVQAYIKDLINRQGLGSKN